MSGHKDGSTNIPQRETAHRDLTLEELTKEAVREIEGKKGFARRAWQWILQPFFSGPRKEICHDWLNTCHFADRAKEYLHSKHSGDSTKKRTFARVQAYLKLAARERDFAQAWTYVNLADALLPLVVDDHELDACILRLRKWDEQMPTYLKKCLEKAKKGADSPGKKQESKQKESPNVSQRSDSDTGRYTLHGEQLVRALLWNIANRRVSLRLSLWRSVGMWLLVGLVAAIVIAESMYSGSDQPKPLVSAPFAAASLLGFFGGGLSAFLKARGSVIRIPSYELIRSHTFLRMLLGAAGSFVIFVAAHWLPFAEIPDLIDSDIFVFLSIGIVAGFSEKLFVGTLEKMAENLNLADATEEEKKPEI